MRYLLAVLSLISTALAEEKPAVNIETAGYSREENVERFSNGTNSFGLRLYREISSFPGNICISPYGIESALAIPYIGSHEATQFQFEKVLHLQGPLGFIDETVSFMNRQLQTGSGGASGDFRLGLASSLWIQNGFAIEEPFLKKMTKSFKDAFKRVEFQRQPETARADINEWVKDRTFGKINGLFAYNEITKTTRMAVTTALYLKGRWASGFSPLNTYQEPFFPDAETTISVPTMVATGVFPCYRGDRFSAVELALDPPRYGKTRAAMLLLLPNHKGGLKELEEELDWIGLQKWMGEIKNEHAQIRLPRFKSFSRIKISEGLKRMGMAAPFGNEADFSGITKSPGAQLKLNEIVHQAICSVDEAGVEAVSAAGAAGAAGAAKTGVIGNPTLYRFDHPFMYIIYDKTLRVILLIGRVNNPLEK